ncbi:MAG: hypothetical protein ACI8S6_004620, partial [Myxococcota bacterium]
GAVGLAAGVCEEREGDGGVDAAADAYDSGVELAAAEVVVDAAGLLVEGMLDVEGALSSEV